MNNRAIILRSYFDVILKLESDADKVKFFKAIVEYQMDGKEPELEYPLDLLWLSILPNIDNSLSKYEKAKQNGRKGGRPKKTQENQTKPNETENNLNKPNETQNNQTETEKKLKKEKEKEKKKEMEKEREMEWDREVNKVGNNHPIYSQQYSNLISKIKATHNDKERGWGLFKKLSQQQKNDALDNIENYVNYENDRGKLPNLYFYLLDGKWEYNFPNKQQKIKEEKIWRV